MFGLHSNVQFNTKQFNLKIKNARGYTLNFPSTKTLKLIVLQMQLIVSIHRFFAILPYK